MRDIDFEVQKCLLCHDALCDKMGDGTERVIRALRFDNKLGARSLYHDGDYGICPHGVDVKKIMDYVSSLENIDVKDVSISSDLCGIKLENPFLLSSSVVSSNYEMCARALDRKAHV